LLFKRVLPLHLRSSVFYALSKTNGFTAFDLMKKMDYTKYQTQNSKPNGSSKEENHTENVALAQKPGRISREPSPAALSLSGHLQRLASSEDPAAIKRVRDWKLCAVCKKLLTTETTETDVKGSVTKRDDFDCPLCRMMYDYAASSSHDHRTDTLLQKNRASQSHSQMKIKLGSLSGGSLRLL
jgi:hypothetical protein